MKHLLTRRYVSRLFSYLDNLEHSGEKLHEVLRRQGPQTRCQRQSFLCANQNEARQGLLSRGIQKVLLQKFTQVHHRAENTRGT